MVGAALYGFLAGVMSQFATVLPPGGRAWGTGGGTLGGWLRGGRDGFGAVG